MTPISAPQPPVLRTVWHSWRLYVDLCRVGALRCRS